MSVTKRRTSVRPKPSIVRPNLCHTDVLREIAQRQANLFAIERGYELIEASAEGFIP